MRRIAWLTATASLWGAAPTKLADFAQIDILAHASVGSITSCVSA